jgi:hypothetical protein
MNIKKDMRYYLNKKNLEKENNSLIINIFILFKINY